MRAITFDNDPTDDQDLIDAVMEELGGIAGAHAFLRKDVVLKPNKDSLTFKGYTVSVDYAQRFEELLRQVRFTYIQPDITSTGHIPMIIRPGVGDFELRLIPTTLATSYVVNWEQELSRLNLRAATVEQLLTFCRDYPDIAKMYSISAPGSLWKLKRLGTTYIAETWYDGYNKQLNLIPLNNLARPKGINHRILAVVKT